MHRLAFIRADLDPHPLPHFAPVDPAAIQGDISNLADLDRIYATVKAQAGWR